MVDPKNLRAGAAAVVLGAGACLLAMLSRWANARPQDNKKTVIRRLTLVKQPAEISVELNGQRVEATEAVRPEEGIRVEEFEAYSNWLKNFRLKLSNKSGKVITYIVIDLTFPETATSENPRVGLHQIFLGIDPDHKFSRSELRLTPNSSIKIPLAAGFNDIKTLVESAPDRDYYQGRTRFACCVI